MLHNIGLENLGLISATKISNKAIILAAKLSRSIEKSGGDKVVLSDSQAISDLIDSATKINDPKLANTLSEFIEELIVACHWDGKGQVSGEDYGALA